MTETGVLTARGLRPLAGPAAHWAARRGTTPAALARAGVVLTAAAAVWFTDTSLTGGLVGALLLASVLYTDAVGGRLAEKTPDRLTEWTFAVLVHVREFVLYAGLAVGAGLAGHGDAWLWASGALVAHALRESVASARAVRRSPPPGGGGAGTSPIDAIDPSGSSREAPDPEFTARLLGAPAAEGGDTEPEGLVRIRTTPPRRGGGLRPLRRGGVHPDPAERRRPPGRAGAALRALVAFAPSERFLVIAVSVTIWGALAALMALVACSAAAAVGAAVLPRRDTP